MRDLKKIQRLRDSGMIWENVAKEFDMPLSTLRSKMQAVGFEPKPGGIGPINPPSLTGEAIEWAT